MASGGGARWRNSDSIAKRTLFVNVPRGHALKGAGNPHQREPSLFFVALAADYDGTLAFDGAVDSKWFQEAIKDDELAEEAAAVEGDRRLNTAESRKRIGDAVTKRYTAPA